MSEPSPRDRRQTKLLLLLLAVACYALYHDSASTRDLREFVRIRDWLFTTTLDSAAWSQIYSVAGRDGSESVNYRAENLRAAAEFLSDLSLPTAPSSLRTTESTVAIVDQILSAMPGPGKAGCGTIRSLRERVERITSGSGYGCCSDFTKVFIVVAAARGLRAREVLNSLHNFVEVWAPESRAWMLVDPQYGLVPMTPAGDFLGALDLARRARMDQRIKWHFAHKNVDYAQQWTASQDLYVQPDAWREIRLPMASNLVEQDRFDFRVRLLPKIVAHFIAYVLHSKPRFVRLNLDPNS
jgi:hypothetical protein